MSGRTRWGSAVVGVLLLTVTACGTDPDRATVATEAPATPTVSRVAQHETIEPDLFIDPPDGRVALPIGAVLTALAPASTGRPFGADEHSLGVE
jgi:hypothetical protein